MAEGKGHGDNSKMLNNYPLRGLPGSASASYTTLSSLEAYEADWHVVTLDPLHHHFRFSSLGLETTKLLPNHRVNPMGRLSMSSGRFGLLYV